MGHAAEERRKMHSAALAGYEAGPEWARPWPWTEKSPAPGQGSPGPHTRQHSPLLINHGVLRPQFQSRCSSTRGPGELY